MKKTAESYSMRSFLVLSSILFLGLTLQAQLPKQLSASEILQEMEGLNTLGSVLYIAAHPDDENTRFISYCANELHLRTAYLSITRGDGGQNLIGKEIGPDLGLIRTNELMAARGVDGGIQYFTPAKDFGYSKSAEETMAIWGEQEVLQDVVRVIRHFRPDVIVCRFPTDGGGGHGHHTASALLAEQAFDLAANPAYATEALKGYTPWQAKRIVVNTGRWWNKDISANDPGVVTEDVGAYVELLGTSCNELAAKSRSMHKSQGFGSTGVRGSQLEYFEHMKGEEAEKGLFDGLDMTWARIPDSQGIQKRLDAMISSYDPRHAEASLQGLLELKNDMKKLQDSSWAAVKQEALDKLIRNCLGLYVEARSEKFYACSGDSVIGELEITCRSMDKLQVDYVKIKGVQGMNTEAFVLEKNVAKLLPIRGTLTQGMPLTSPYWLAEEGSLGRYMVKEKENLVKPVAGPAIIVKVQFKLYGVPFDIEVPLIQKENDPVKGELWRPFIISPAMTVQFRDENLFLLDEQVVTSAFTITAQSDMAAQRLSFANAEGWNMEPSNFDIPAMKKGERMEMEFRVNASLEEGRTILQLSSDKEKGKIQSLNTIAYDHIPTQVIIRDASMNLIKIKVNRAGGKIGYIPGAGDKVAESLAALGYQVDILDEVKLKAGGLEKYKAIITGIRLFNVDERVAEYVPILNAYCEAGGNVILQYNTRHEMKTEDIAPYMIKLSRDRITEEDAKVEFLEKKHPVMSSPNKITAADFEGWEQERGLYFPDAWADEFTPILSWHDKGEDAKKGALLIAEYGKGNFVYTGISFFRELPAGVPGAYRLMVNLIELPKHD